MGLTHGEVACYEDGMPQQRPGLNVLQQYVLYARRRRDVPIGLHTGRQISQNLQDMMWRGRWMTRELHQTVRDALACILGGQTENLLQV